MQDPPPHVQPLLPLIAASRPGELWLLVAPFRIQEIELKLIPILALRGPVHIIIGGQALRPSSGQGYDVDGILRSLRKLTPHAERMRKRIRQRRAPTAFQMRALLKETPAARNPLIVLNFLVHYFDEDEAFWKSRYLLEDSLAELQRLSRLAPVVVTVRSPKAGEGRYAQILDRLREGSDKVIEFARAPALKQPRLF